MILNEPRNNTAERFTEAIDGKKLAAGECEGAEFRGEFGFAEDARYFAGGIVHIIESLACVAANDFDGSAGVVDECDAARALQLGDGDAEMLSFHGVNAVAMARGFGFELASGKIGQDAEPRPRGGELIELLLFGGVIGMTGDGEGYVVARLAEGIDDLHGHIPAFAAVDSADAEESVASMLPGLFGKVAGHRGMENEGISSKHAARGARDELGIHERLITANGGQRRFQVWVTALAVEPEKAGDAVNGTHLDFGAREIKSGKVDVLESGTAKIGLILRVQQRIEAALAIEAAHPSRGQAGFEQSSVGSESIFCAEDSLVARGRDEDLEITRGERGAKGSVNRFFRDGAERGDGDVIVTLKRLDRPCRNCVSSTRGVDERVADEDALARHDSSYHARKPRCTSYARRRMTVAKPASAGTNISHVAGSGALETTLSMEKAYLPIPTLLCPWN